MTDRYEPHCDCLGGHVSMVPDPNGRWCRVDEGWQDISTAPQTDEYSPLMLLWVPHDVGGYIFVGTRNFAGNWIDNLVMDEHQPTHWRSLPPPSPRRPTMPDPTDPHPVADDPSGIVQQMPEGRLRAEGRCSTDSTMRHFAYAVMVPDPDGDYVEYEKARATEADLRADVERQAYERGWRAAIEAAASHCWSKRDLLADAEKKQVAAGLTGRDYYGRRLEAELLSRTIRAISPETDGGQNA